MSPSLVSHKIVCFLRDRRFDTKLKLAVFDMDGVLVDVKSSWHFVHEAFDRSNWENVKKYTKGEISYSELMRRDIALWGRVHIDKIKSILTNAPLMLGASETFECLRTTGLKTALISAGVSILAERLQAILEIDHIFANGILTDQRGFLIGEGEETVSLLDKLEVFKAVASMEKVSLSECGVVGDSSYDIPMFRKAGLSIAFNANEDAVRKAADVVIQKKDLREILPYLTQHSE